MCQLTAVIPQREITDNEKALQRFLMTELMFNNSRSGNRDGCGLANEKWYWRSGNPAEKAMQTPEYLDAINNMLGTPIIGHVRAVSTGEQGREGAHPFIEGTITLAHNGTFSSYQTLDAYKSFGEKENPVDSHVVARELANRLKNKPLDLKTLESVLKDANGSYAMLIMDAVSEKLWVVRGSCSLNQTKIGPFTVINTSKQSLEAVTYLANRVSRYYTGGELEVDNASSIELQTANVVNAEGGLDKVGDLSTFRSNQLATQACAGYYRNYEGYSSKHITNDLLDSTVCAELADMIYSTSKVISGLTVWEMKTVIENTLGKKWYELGANRLSAMCQALEELNLEMNNARKGSLWLCISRELVNNKLYKNPYTALSDLGFTIDCPFFAATETQLKTIAEEIGERCENTQNLIES